MKGLVKFYKEVLKICLGENEFFKSQRKIKSVVWKGWNFLKKFLKCYETIVKGFNNKVKYQEEIVIGHRRRLK